MNQVDTPVLDVASFVELADNLRAAFREVFRPLTAAFEQLSPLLCYLAAVARECRRREVMRQIRRLHRAVREPRRHYRPRALVVQS